MIQLQQHTTMKNYNKLKSKNNKVIHINNQLKKNVQQEEVEQEQD